MSICQQNLLHALQLQKQAQNKGMKPRSHAPDGKVWLKVKYIKIKQNWKVETKFFRLFQVIYLMSQQIDNLQLPIKWRIHDVINMSILEQDIRKKSHVNVLLGLKLELNIRKDKEYGFEIIKDILSSPRLSKVNY